ncbi:hypothetical protein [Vibrio phage RYC]|nr:hypothetical protein [Vibrio phage RYC]
MDNYEIYVSPPKLLRDGEVHEIRNKVNSTFFISAIEYPFPNLVTKARTDFPDKIKNGLYIEGAYEGIAGIQQEGFVFRFKIKPRYPLTASVTVDWTITYDNIDVSGMFDTNEDIDEDFEETSLHLSATDSDFVEVSGTETIPDGSDGVEVMITTVNDNTPLMVANQFKLAKVSLSNASDGMQIYDDISDSLIFLFEPDPVPAIEGSIDIGAKLYKLLPKQPIIDSSTSAQASIDMGVDAEGESLARTQIIDDLPVHSFFFEPNGVKASDDSVDYTTVPRFYQVIIQSTRR